MEGWKFADFVIKFRTSTPLWSVRRYIKERHGHVENLELYRSPKHLITDYSLTLAKLGFVGGPPEAHIEALLKYDFISAQDDAILTREPDLTIPFSAEKELKAQQIVEDMPFVSDFSRR